MSLEGTEAYVTLREVDGPEQCCRCSGHHMHLHTRDTWVHVQHAHKLKEMA